MVENLCNLKLDYQEPELFCCQVSDKDSGRPADATTGGEDLVIGCFDDPPEDRKEVI